MTKLTYFLEDWIQRQPEPRGKLYVGEIGCLLARNPDSGFGIDLAYLAPSHIADVQLHRNDVGRSADVGH